MKKYAIVKSKLDSGDWIWRAYRYNFMFKVFNIGYVVVSSFNNADCCERKLITFLESKKIKPEIVKIVKI